MARQERKKKRLARKRLLLLATRLRAGCGAVLTIDDWYQSIGELRRILGEHGDAIPLDDRRRLEWAMQLPESPLDDLAQACRLLTLEVEKVAAVLVSGSIAASLAAAVTLLALISVAAVAVYANLAAVPITVHNQGCEPIFLTTGLPFSDDALQLAGIDLLTVPILSGSQGTITAPPSTVFLDGQRSGQLEIILAGQAIPVITEAASDIQVDGRSIIGRRESFDIGSRPAHDIVVTCPG